MKVITSMDQVADVLKENNIELVTFDHLAFYDTHLARFYFEEFKQDWQDQSLWFGDRQTDYIVFFANKALMNAPHYKISHLRKMLKNDLFDLCDHFDLVSYGADEDEYTKAELIEMLMEITAEEFYKKHFEETSFHDLDYDFSITGYSQGDRVLIKKVGTEKEFLNNDRCNIVDEDSLTNLFYDTPKYLKIECFVNGEIFEEIDLLEFIDLYSFYEKSECVDVLKKHYHDFKYYDLLVEYVEDHFPAALNYN